MSELLLNVVIIAKENTSIRFLTTLESIINQEYYPIKIIVVDLNEQNSLYSFGLQEDLIDYKQVKYLKLDDKLSLAEVRNNIIDQIEGEYISFISNNDVWDSTFALRLINHLKSDSEVMAVCSNGILIDERRSKPYIKPLIENTNDNLSSWISNSPVQMSAQVIYNIKAFKSLGGFDDQFEPLCDADMFLRLKKKGKVIISMEDLCECRLTSTHIEYEWKLFLDYKSFRIKHLELFIIGDKKLRQVFYWKMIKLAIVNLLWIDCITYIFMYFYTAPFRTIRQLFDKLGSMVFYIIKWLRRELSISHEKIKTRHMISRMLKNNGKSNDIPKEIILKKAAESKILTFQSNKMFNEKSSLKYAFNNNIEKVIIPPNVTVIKKGMFYGCKQLVEVEIPNSVIEIEDHVFHNCVNLKQVIIEEASRINKIGAYAFAGCVNLEELIISSSVSQIGKYAFANCLSLNKLEFESIIQNRRELSYIFPSQLDKVPSYAFLNCRNLTKLEFSDNSMLEKIEDGAFFGCSGLENIVITGSVKHLGDYAFALCRQVSATAFLKIDLLKNIGKGAFIYCESLPYFQLPRELERIRTRTFYGCSRLKFIKIPDKVLYINHQAFRKCPLLSSVTILSEDIMISNSAFDAHTKIRTWQSETSDKK